MSNGSDIILNVKVNLSELEVPEKIFSSLKSAMNSAINESFKNAKINLNSSINVQSNKNENNKESSTDKVLKDLLTFSNSALKELSKINNTLKNTSRENLKNERKKENFDKAYFKQIHEEKNQNKLRNSFFSGLAQLGVITGILSNRDIKKGLKYGNLLAERYSYRVYDKNGNLTDERKFNPVSIFGDVFSWGKALFNVATKIYDTLKKNYEQVSTQVELFKTLLETSEKEVDLSNYLTRAESFGHLNTVNALATHSDISFDKALEIGKDFYNNEENLLGFGRYKNINGTEFEGAEVKYKTDSENIIALVQAAVQGIVDMQTKDGAITSVRLTKEQQDKRMKELTRQGISSYDMKNFLEMEQRNSNGNFDMNRDRLISSWNYTGDRTLMEQKRNEAIKKLGNGAIEDYDRQIAETKNKYLRTQDYAFLEDGEKNLQLISEIFKKELEIRRAFLQNLSSILSGKSLTLNVDKYKTQSEIFISNFIGGNNNKLIKEFQKKIDRIAQTTSDGKSFKYENAMKVLSNKNLYNELIEAIKKDDKVGMKSIDYYPNITKYLYDIQKKYGLTLPYFELSMLEDLILTDRKIMERGDLKSRLYKRETLEYIRDDTVQYNVRQQTDYK